MSKAEILRGNPLARMNLWQFELSKIHAKTKVRKLPVNLWTQGEGNYYADINIPDVSDVDYAEIDFDKSCKSVVATANIDDVGDSLAGKLRIYAYSYC